MNFEKYNVKDEDVENGYGDWLKSDDDINTENTTKKIWVKLLIN